MKVKAKCIAEAWDSANTTFFYPGEEYTIEHDGELANMRTRRGFVFQFDRTMAGTGQKPALGGYACKQCPLVCDSLNDLGTHTRSAHQEVMLTEEIDENEPVVVEKRGKTGKKFTCKECGAVTSNLWELRVHKKTHAAETVAVPA